MTTDKPLGEEFCRDRVQHDAGRDVPGACLKDWRAPFAALGRRDDGVADDLPNGLALLKANASPRLAQLGRKVAGCRRRGSCQSDARSCKSALEFKTRAPP